MSLKWDTHLSKEETARTTKLLKEVANHLASNTKYRKTEFVLIISRESNKTALQILPCGMDVFPDTHKRKPSDKTNILKHVLSEHLLDEQDVQTLNYDLTQHEITIDNQNLFIYGVYKYKLSYNGKQRRWIRITNH